MRQLTRLERRWYVRGFLPADAVAANEYDEYDPFFSEYYFLLRAEQKRNFNWFLMIACMQCGRAVFNNYVANQQLAWSTQANDSNALPILGLYLHCLPQLICFDNSWKVHLYGDTIYCFCLMIHLLKHIIKRNNEFQNRPKWTSGAAVIDLIDLEHISSLSVGWISPVFYSPFICITHTRTHKLTEMLHMSDNLTEI